MLLKKDAAVDVSIKVCTATPSHDISLDMLHPTVKQSHCDAQASLVYFHLQHLPWVAAATLTS